VAVGAFLGQGGTAGSIILEVLAAAASMKPILVGGMVAG
jgi:hypothetical protein